MKSAAQIADHPLHPMLVVVPAGAFIIALVLDVGYLISGAELWWNATVPVMIIGVIGALLAALPGAVDLFQVARREEGAFRVGLAHMGVNLLLVAVFIFNFALRLDAAPPRGGIPPEFWLTVAGVGLLGVSGWLGWHMVYNYRVGVADKPTGAVRADEPERTREAPEGGERSPA
ncbi:MAG: DUF2231 domain-containing protein [Persicimonas sp.]